jgi:hypothetical protein
MEKSVSLTNFYGRDPPPSKNLLDFSVRQKAASVRLLSTKKCVYAKINIVKNRKNFLRFYAFRCILSPS